MQRLIYCLAWAAANVAAVEPAIVSSLEDGDSAVWFAAPDANLPLPSQQAFNLPVGARPHGLAFRGGSEALFADFSRPVLYRGLVAAPGAVTTVALAGRSSGNGTLAVDPNGRYAISIGESPQGEPEGVVVDFATTPPAVTPLASPLRVRGFVTAAIDFAPDGRAFVCHTMGVGVLKPPYTTVDFTMAFPATHLTPSMCRLTPDGGRLFVTRMLSETLPTVNGVRTTSAPYSAASSFTVMPAPDGVQGLGPMAVSPDGKALLVGQQFLFPPESGTRARAFVLRAPFGGNTVYQEVTMPASLAGVNCTAEGQPRDCPGFEHIEVSDDASLALLTGNSSSVVTNVADRVPMVFLRNPFDEQAQDAVAVQVLPTATTPGRGAGGVRFRPAHVFRDGLEVP